MHLLALPSEIILHIATKLYFPEDIVSLACTNTALLFLLSELYEHQIRKDRTSLLLWSIKHCQRALLARLVQYHSPDVNRDDELGQTPIFYAILSHDAGVCACLLESSRVDINWKNYIGETPLIFALSQRATAIIPLLLKYSPDLDIVDNRKRTALWYAVSLNEFDIVQMLLERGSNINIPDYSRHDPLNVAINTGNISIVRQILVHSRMFPSIPSMDTYPVVCSAARKGDLDILRLLLHFGEDVNARNRCHYSRTPLIDAISYGHYDICVELLKHPDIYVNIKNDYDGSTALHRALALSDAVVSLLLYRDDIDHNIRDDSGSTILWEAVSFWNPSTVFFILDSWHDVDINLTGGHEKTTILHEAAAEGNMMLLSYLLDRKDLDPNVCDQTDYTALGHAAHWNNIDMVNLLLSRQDVDTNRGISPLWIAARRGNTKVVLRLLEAPDAKVNDTFKSLTPLLAAIVNNQFETARIFLTKCRSQDINAKTRRGETALSIVASSGKLDMVELIVRHPSMDLSCDDIIQKAIQEAANARQLRVARFLASL